MDSPAFAPMFSHPPSELGGPSWPVALLFPLQGQWTEGEYLAVQKRSRRLVELSEGQIEVLSVPNPYHQRIVRYLFRLIEACVAALGSGEVFFAPLPIRLWPGKYRDPDIAYFRPGRIPDPQHQPQGADLVMEVVSDEEEDRQRDFVTKRQEYAQAGVAEYWIIDPKTETIVVLVLDGAAYRLHGEFPLGAMATSVLLPTFSVAVTAVFAAGHGTRDARTGS
jgi:Uma2 family endonuclease